MHLENTCLLAISNIQKNKHSFEQRLKGMCEQSNPLSICVKGKLIQAPKVRGTLVCIKGSREARGARPSGPREKVIEKVRKYRGLIQRACLLF